MLDFLLHLVAHTLGTVHILHSCLFGLHLELALASCVERAVAAHLEVGDGGLCNHSLAEWNFLLLRLVVVRYNLVHAALLKIHRLSLWNDEVGVNLFLSLVEGVGEDDECCALRNFGRSAILVRAVGLRTVHGSADGVARCRVVACHEQHEVFARCLGRSVLGIAVHALGEQRAVRSGNFRIVGEQRQDELLGCSCGHLGCRCHAGARLVNHVVLHLGRIHLYFLRFQHELHKRCVVTLELVEFLVEVALYEVARTDSASRICHSADGSGCSRHLACYTGCAWCRGGGCSSTYLYGFSVHVLKF